MKIVNCLAIYITSAFAFGCTKNDSSVVNHDMTLSQSKEINLLVEAHTNPDEVRRRAELGDAEAQYALGEYLTFSAEGKGGAAIREAVDWHRKAGDQNHSGALRSLGDIFLFMDSWHDFIEPSPGRSHKEEALECYRKSALAGNFSSMHLVGGMYFKLSRDEENAEKRKAFAIESFAWEMAFLSASPSLLRHEHGIPAEYIENLKQEARDRLKPEHHSEAEALAQNYIQSIVEK